MAAVLKPSVNVFALLESDDPGDTRLANVGAKAKADAAAMRHGNAFSKKQPPQMSAWKINKLKTEAEAAAAKQQQEQLAAASTNTNTGGGKNRTPQQQQQLVASTKTNTAGNNRKSQQPATVPSKGGHAMAKGNVGKNSKPQPPALPPRAQLSAAAANAAGMNMKPKQPAAASTAHVNTTANARGNEQFRQQQQQPVEPAEDSLSLGDQLNAYANSVRTLVYKNRKQNAKGSVAGGAAKDDKKGGQPNGASVKKDAPAPVQEGTPAPATAAGTEHGGLGSVPAPGVELKFGSISIKY